MRNSPLTLLALVLAVVAVTLWSLLGSVLILR